MRTMASSPPALERPILRVPPLSSQDFARDRDAEAGAGSLLIETPAAFAELGYILVRQIPDRRRR